jgi:hypothetical protein
MLGYLDLARDTSAAMRKPIYTNEDLDRIITGCRPTADAREPGFRRTRGNKIYVLDYGGTQALWEVTLPSS